MTPSYTATARGNYDKRDHSPSDPSRTGVLGVHVRLIDAYRYTLAVRDMKGSAMNELR